MQVAEEAVDVALSHVLASTPLPTGAALQPARMAEEDRIYGKQAVKRGG